MYLLPITVPIFVEGSRSFIATDWRRALVLLRDSLQGRYGPLVVAAPSAPAAETDQPLEAADRQADGIELLPLFDRVTPLNSYWGGVHQATMARIDTLLTRTTVLHGTAEDPLRPFTYSSVMRAARKRLPVVFVQDQDVSRSMRDIADTSGLAARLKLELQAQAHVHQCRRATRVAGLCLFKGKDTIARYGHLTRHLLEIEDTSYTMDEMVPENRIRERLATLVSGQRPLRFGFCGRLVQIKGLDRSLRILAAARARGANVAFDIIGTGPELAALRALAVDLGMADHVAFHGGMPYGPMLLSRLAGSDALLFNPRMSETPRMLFDAYAAGLPIVADDIDYVRQRAAGEQATVLLPWKDDAAAVETIVGLDADRGQLVPLTERALQARVYHAADTWYRRRAEATHAMVDRVRGDRR